MSIRKRPNLLIDKFDSTTVGTFDDIPHKGETYESPVYQTTPAVTFHQSIDILSILLKDYQSKHYGCVYGDKTYQVFPFCWTNLVIGDEIQNITTGEIYRVESLMTHPDFSRNVVKLKCPTPPEPWHLLRLDDKKNKYLRFVPAYPDSEAKPYEFNTEGYLQYNEDPNIPYWMDTITYSEMSFPGSRSDGMFSGNNVETRPKYRMSTQEGDVWGQIRDVRLRLDFWTRDNKDSELLREWFLSFYIKYFWLIEANGLDHFMWKGNVMSEAVTRWRTDIIHRSSLYEYRIEHSYLKDLFKIREIAASAIIPKDPEAMSLKGETISISV